MGNIYDGAFRTILNDCRQMIIPVINEVFKERIAEKPGRRKQQRKESSIKASRIQSDR